MTVCCITYSSRSTFWIGKSQLVVGYGITPYPTWSSPTGWPHLSPAFRFHALVPSVLEATPLLIPTGPPRRPAGGISCRGPAAATPLSSLSSWHGLALNPPPPPLAAAGRAPTEAATVGAAGAAAVTALATAAAAGSVSAVAEGPAI